MRKKAAASKLTDSVAPSLPAFARTRFADSYNGHELRFSLQSASPRAKRRRGAGTMRRGSERYRDELRVAETEPKDGGLN
jgi:hypothetical protein